MRAQLVARTRADRGLVYRRNSTAQPNILDIGAPGNQDAWTVPRGAFAPYRLNAFGFAKSDTDAKRAFFNGSPLLSGTQRTAPIKCATRSADDTHCDSQAAQQYAEGTRVHF